MVRRLAEDYESLRVGDLSDPAAQPGLLPLNMRWTAPGHAGGRGAIFDPIEVVLTYKDEAIAIANDTEFGLAASVYPSDHERAMRVAPQDPFRVGRRQHRRILPDRAVRRC